MDRQYIAVLDFGSQYAHLIAPPQRKNGFTVDENSANWKPEFIALPPIVSEPAGRLNFPLGEGLSGVGAIRLFPK